jgi:Putative peptidoglycan binding domain
MKHLIISICTGLALAAASLTQAKQQNDNDTSTTTVHRGSRGNSQAQAAPGSTRHVTRTSPVRTQRSVSTTSLRQRTYTSTPRFSGNTVSRSANTTNARLRERNFRQNDQARVQSNVAVNRNRNFRNRTFSRNGTANVTVNRNRNVTITNNWRGSRFSGQQYAAFRNYHRQWHDRGWWSSHYNRIIFVGGGWYFWNSGYWYPAWGYDPYAYYPYDGPIYGYGNLTPDQIVVDVQTQLQRDGYYAGPIDGQLGPMTRQAIAAFQADHGLAVTSTVDEPTMASLGIS